MPAGWQPGRWWRAVDPDGGVWCESSDEAEVRAAAHPDHRVERQWRLEVEEWRVAPSAAEVERAGILSRLAGTPDVDDPEEP